MKKIKFNRIVFNILCVFALLMIITLNFNCVQARKEAREPTVVIPDESYSGEKDPISNPGSFDPSKGGTIDPGIATATEKASGIFGIIQVAGIVVAVITLSIMGIKYMVGSIEERAEYKKTMVPYIIGIIFVVAILGLLTTFNSMVTGILK